MYYTIGKPLSSILMDLTRLTASYRCKLVIKALNNWVKHGENVLDVGCGNGIITKLLMRRLGIRIVGCDVKNYLTENDISFVRIRNHKLPFHANQFNTILLLDVLHHASFREQINLIQESLRVANKVIIFEARPTIMGKITDIILNKYHYGSLDVPLTFRNYQEWKSLFRQLSLKYQIVVLDRPFWYPFSHIAILLQKN